MSPTAATRRSLHGIAELVLAGPQFRASGRIRLRVTPGGFGTTAEPDLRVDHDELVAGTQRIQLAGATYAEVARAAGVEAGAPSGLYGDGSGVQPGEQIVLEPQALETVVSAYAAGDEALRRFAPGSEPVLWPEHFDLAVTADEINRRQGPFWTAPFGAARPLRALDDIAAFFEEGRKAAG
jgi:hypothetical protein